MSNAKTTMPALAMRGLVIFPRMILHFDVGRDYSIKALRAAADGSRRIFLAAQKDPSIIDPLPSDVYKVGVVAEVRQMLKTPDGTTRVLVEGLYRAKANDFHKEGEYYIATPSPLNDRRNTILTYEEATAYLRTVKNIYATYCSYVPKMPKELYEGAMAEKDLTKLTDLIIFNTYLKPEDRQELLETVSEKKRVELLMTILTDETEILKLETEISCEVSENMDKNQREYYLREQLRVISRQLGGEDSIEDAYDYEDRIYSIGFPQETEEKLIKEAEKLLKLSPSSQDYGLIRTYLDTVLDMPWNKKSSGKISMTKAEKQLDKDHYGLKKVKERILETIAVRALNPETKGQIICLAGPPGVGKTSVGRSIAKAIDRSYARISLGGVGDEAEIRGHRKTYIGAMPGRIVKAVRQAKTMNPVIVLDEIDKLCRDYKGDPSSALLEVLDPEQNIAFVDHYLEIPLDLSDVMFITTANSLDTIPAPLLDRMEVIELPSYTREEKFNIAKRHLVPKQLKKHGEKASQLKISDEALYAVIDGYTKEAGVRKLEQRIAALCRKAARELVDGKTKVAVTDKNLSDFLGVQKYQPETLPEQDEIGVVTGLAWTSVGGVTMPLEVLVMNGTGKIELTGSLGEVMTESGKIAVSLVRSIADKYGVDPDFYKTKDLHIHAPEGAVPKDGPSAGVTMTTALVSALSGIAVKREVAMTGEITLHGKVLPIGGLREKSMAAYKAGVKTLIMPYDNKPDLDEVDEVVKQNISFIPVKNIENVLENALAKPNTNTSASAFDGSGSKRGRKRSGKAKPPVENGGDSRGRRRGRPPKNTAAE